MNISRYKLQEWRTRRDRLAAQGATAKIAGADREIAAWEQLGKIEDAATALVDHARTAKNLPGELRYHLDNLARSIDTRALPITRAEAPAPKPV